MDGLCELLPDVIALQEAVVTDGYDPCKAQSFRIFRLFFQSTAPNLSPEGADVLETENAMSEDQKTAEKRAVFDVRGKAVLVHTGWDVHWRTERYFEGHPFLTVDAARYLAGSGGLRSLVSTRLTSMTPTTTRDPLTRCSWEQVSRSSSI